MRSICGCVRHFGVLCKFFHPPEIPKTVQLGKDWSVIIRVTAKLDDQEAGVRFLITSMITDTMCCYQLITTITISHKSKSFIWPFKAQFKGRILNAPNRIAELSACKMRRLNRLNVTYFNSMRVSRIFDWCRIYDWSSTVDLNAVFYMCWIEFKSC